jgi:hypothetical protein
MLKALMLASLAALVLTAGGAALWFYAHRPPNCTDPDTVALVHQSLVAHHHLPPSTTLEDIRTIAGGAIAFRFVCTAFIGGFDPHKLPQGTPVPGVVNYTSQLTPDRKRHEVTVEVEPILKWVKVQ